MKPVHSPKQATRRAFYLAAILTGVVIVCDAIPLLDAQAPAAETVIRAETREVLIDAVAIDKKGAFVRDLAQKDFRVWEDGKEQKIAGFSLESSGVSPERSSKHYIALFFDTSTAGQSGVATQAAERNEAARFVDGFASPDRYMAVVNYNYDGGVHIAQNFTSDAARVKKALSAVPGAESSALSRPTAGAPAGAAAEVDEFAYREMLASLRSLANSLAEIRGRKALVVFIGNMSFSGDLQSDIDATIAALNKANVAVYTVGSGAHGLNSGSVVPDADTAGTASGPRRNPRPQQQPVQSATTDLTDPIALAEGTGGLAFLTTADLAQSLGKVAQEQDQYYLLSYTPAVASSEGSCHDLRVKVDRGDLEVRARKSYCTSKPPDLLSGKPAGQDLETKAAGGAAVNIDAQMQLPWFYSAANVARVNLAMDMTPSAMKFTKEKGKLHGELNLEGVAYNPDGSVAARVGDIVKFDFDTPQQVSAFLAAPYHYENQFDIAPGQYKFRMAFSSGDKGFGKIEMPLAIDPWNGQTLSASGLALSHEARAAADLASGLDVSLLEGPRPLVAKGTEVIPAGSNQFHAGTPGFFYFELYEPLLKDVKPDAPLPAVGIRIRVLDRATGAQKTDSGIKMAGTLMRAGDPVVPVISALPVAALPAGAYKLEISVMREFGQPVVRTADFDIN